MSELLWRDSRVAIRRISVSAMDNNAYLLTSLATARQILIDAADDADALTALLADSAADLPEPAIPTCDAIITTHSHWDHIRALASLAQSTGARLYAGQPDIAAIESGAGVEQITEVWQGDTITVADIALDVIGLRGHTPGSIALVYTPPEGFEPDHLDDAFPVTGHDRADATHSLDPQLGPRFNHAHHDPDDAAPTMIFTGDSLFPGGVGNTNHDPERFASLLEDVTMRLFAQFPDSTRIHPGHGAPTTLGRERPHLAEWKARGW